MAKTRLRTTTKRYGPRYGARNKIKAARIEEESRRKHKCPYCNYIQVRRISKGIWFCSKCKVKFVGKAYTIPKEKKKEITPEIYDLVSEDMYNKEEAEEQEA
ncbi:50S ribosomal protein L37ae [Candidatus Woesearchaeota archaeon]|jgi:large subunit ribosomal protein L37Ae|nr:50S ribosomal protein L37ae [Candidatus Woesearchaeota archaeon]